MTPRAILDANVILRFVVGDHPTHSPQALALFERAAAGSVQLIAPSLIVAECVYALSSIYKRSRGEIAQGLEALLSAPGVRPLEGEVVLQALRLYGAHRVDFPDAYLAAIGAGLSLPVATFDRDVKKLGADVLSFEV